MTAKFLIKPPNLISQLAVECVCACVRVCMCEHTSIKCTHDMYALYYIHTYLCIHIYVRVHITESVIKFGISAHK